MSTESNVITASGMRIRVSPTLPATHDVVGFQALSDWITVAQVVDAGEGGKAWNSTDHSPLETAEVETLKTTFSQGNRDIQLGRDLSNDGQAALIEYNDIYTAVSFELTYQNGNITYFTAKVLSFTEADGTAESVVSSTVSASICNDIIRLLNTGVLTATINDGGTFTGLTDGVFPATQASTSGDGKRAEFEVTLVAGAVTAATVTNTGTGYIVADTVTLTVVGPTESAPAVLDVATILPAV